MGMTMKRIENAAVTATVAAAIVVLTGCGGTGTQRVSAEGGPGALDAGTGGVCGGASTVAPAELQRIGHAVSHSQFAESLNAVELESVDQALAGGGRIVVGEVVAVNPVDLEPLTLLPGDEAGRRGSNTYAGNSAYWGGAVVVVSVDGEAVELPMRLAVGGADVIEALGPQVAEEDLASLVGTCAMGIVGADEEALVGETRVVALASDERAAPVALDARFRGIVADAATLGEMVPENP